jgi:hypothetical protein
MKNSKGLRLLCLIVFALGCSSISVTTDFDNKVDFTRLSTYSWLPNPETPSEGIQAELAQNTLIEGRVKNAVDAKLASKGIRKTTQDPDMLVAFHTGVQDKVDVRSWGYGYGGYWGYGGTGVTTVNYQEGTLILDFIDPKTKELMWRGVGKKVLSEKTTPEKSEKTIREAVEKILEKYPPS